jgi:hypothetical protein
MGKQGKKTLKPAPAYNPTAQERAAVERVLEQQANKPPAAKFNIETTTANVTRISPDHPEPSIPCNLLLDALGTGNYEFAKTLLTQLADLARSGKIATNEELNSSFPCAYQSKDETEALWRPRWRRFTMPRLSPRAV